jgi:hypothetical protein
MVEYNCVSTLALGLDALVLARLANSPREGGFALYVSVHSFNEIFTLD